MHPIDLNQIIKEINLVGMRNWLRRQLVIAFRDARKNKLTTFNEHNFDERWMDNINRLENAILEKYYKPGASIAFIVFDPMIREIFAAPFADRVVHHFLYNMQAGWWDCHFILDSYSCRVGKGTLYGVTRAHKHMQSASNNFTEEAYAIKLDIKGYFMSLPHQKLLDRIKWGLNQQFAPYMHHSAAHELYKICLFLWHQIIMDNPVEKAIWRCPKRYQKMVPTSKTLRAQAPGYGIVIGNTTSQLASNIYLDQMDRFVKFNLGYQHYGRYVDDSFIIVPATQYQQAKKDIKLLEKYLTDELELTLHPRKRSFQSIYKGMSFIGTRIYPHCYYPSNRMQGKFEHVISEIAKGHPIDRAVVTSYFGFFYHLDANQYIERIFRKYGLDPTLYFAAKAKTRPINEIMDELLKLPPNSQIIPQ